MISYTIGLVPNNFKLENQGIS